jgi:hypothetical protein
MCICSPNIWTSINRKGSTDIDSWQFYQRQHYILSVLICCQISQSWCLCYVTQSAKSLFNMDVNIVLSCEMTVLWFPLGSGSVYSWQFLGTLGCSCSFLPWHHVKADPVLSLFAHAWAVVPPTVSWPLCACLFPGYRDDVALPGNGISNIPAVPSLQQ